MPLTERVNFKTVLQKGNRVQVPKLVRWRYKLDSEQVLKVSVGSTLYGSETFYARMDRSGRVTVPKLTLELLASRLDEQDVVGKVLEVELKPA